MAEWILDFFRRSHLEVGQAVPFRLIQHAQLQLSQKERTLFLNVMNELLGHNYFTFEQEPIQCLRLSKKGYNYISGLTPTLDCCIDKRVPTEVDLRTLIELGLTVNQLQRYSELLKYGTAIEEINKLYNQLVNFDYTASSNYTDLKLETIKEYYEVIFRNIYLTCKAILDIDDEHLLVIINGYIEMAINSFSQYKLTKVPVEQNFDSLILQAKSKLRDNEQQTLLLNFKKYLNQVFIQY